METALIFLLFIIIVVILGFGGYFAYDYIQYKKTLETEFEKANKDIVANQTAISAEQKTRVSSMKYVVDQVNTTNEDIYSTFTSNVADTKKTTDTLTDRQLKMLNGLNSVMRFSTSTVSNGSNLVDILSLPGAPTVNMELMKRVNVLNGMTFNELSATKNVKLCGVPDGGGDARCMEFPNADGKTVFTNLVQNKPLVFNANAEFSSNVLFANADGGLLESSSTAQPLKIRSSKFVHVANNLAVGDNAEFNTDVALPTMAIHSIDTTKDAMKVSTSTKANAVRVDANGRLVLANTNTFETDANNKLLVNTQGLRITAPATADVELQGRTIVLQGDVDIQGNVRVNGVPINVQNTATTTTTATTGSSIPVTTSIPVTATA